MKYEIPDDPEALKKLCRDLIDELDVARSDLSRERDDNTFLLAAIQSLPNATFVTDELGSMIVISQEYENIFGINKNLFLGKDARNLTYFSPEERISYFEENEELLANPRTIHREVNFSFSDGESHPCFYWVRGFSNEKANRHGIVGQIVDITKERKMEAALREAKDKIEEASKIDPGTGLYNRYVFSSQTINLIKAARETGSPLSVMMADLDHFKRVNDSFGHLEGDRILKDFATLIKSNIRNEDVPIRYGGEEFLVFLPDTDLPKAIMVAERIRQACESTLSLPDESYMTVSIGLVKFDPNETRTQCIERADQALYTAKESGRNRVVTFASDKMRYMG